METVNRILKKPVTKVTLETGGDSVSLLHYALYRARHNPYTLDFTHFEILYGKPPLILAILQSDILDE